MKRCFETNKLIAAIAISAAVALPSLAMAQVRGHCSDCHTMHNSQDGVALDASEHPALTKGGCVGCHTTTSNIAVSAAGNIPYVNHTTTEPTNGTLAGGSFYWVQSDASKGHNVVGVGAAAEPLMSAVPGVADGALNVPAVGALTCSGSSGCHGTRTESNGFTAISGGHHGTGGAAVTADPTTKTYVAGTSGDLSDSYRMLDGIEGIEDIDWEDTATATDHNLYSGAHRTDESATTGTISSLCAQCHGEFHNGSGSIGTGSPWVRHPTDFDMSTLATDSEYAGYTTYSLEAPVAVSSMSAATDLSLINHAGGLDGATGNAIVTCLSCHRAHGSPYKDLLRWDYGSEMAHEDGDVNTGCYNCHTTKDDV